MLPPATADLYAAQQRRVLASVLLLRRQWAQMSEDLDASWAQIGPRVLVVVASAQLGAARDGAAAVPLALSQQRQSVAPSARVVPEALRGVASDGRTLDGLLLSSVTTVKRAISNGASLPDALAMGGRNLEMIAHTQIGDAARDASSLAVTARPRVQWVRMVNPPCCQRCAVLAGHVYRYSQGFRRHPRCDCLMVPQTVANPDAVGRVIGPDDVKDLTRLQRKAIADGADFNKVINEYNRKGAYHLPPTRVDEITARAASRQQAVEALQQAGYLAA